jgi:hypothetical protein
MIEQRNGNLVVNVEMMKGSVLATMFSTLSEKITH